MDQDTAETSPGISGCLYDSAGVLCGEKVRARGFCKRHYNILARRGAFKPTEKTSLAPGSAVTEQSIARNLGHIERARLRLEEHTETLVNHLLLAAEIAAKKGDSRPAEWALLHSRTVQPVLTGGGTSSKDAPAGIRVIVGVNLGQSNSSPAIGQSAVAQIAGPPDPAGATLPTVEATLISSE